MKKYAEGTIVAHLKGDLTYSGATRTIINSLSASLQQIVSAGEKYFRIDCKKIRTADISGLQLLFVWMQCARFRGVEAELVNLSISLQKCMRKLGFGTAFTENSAHPKTQALFTVL